MTTITAVVLIAFAVGPFVAKLIYGMQLHRRESKKISKKSRP